MSDKVPRAAVPGPHTKNHCSTTVPNTYSQAFIVCHLVMSTLIDAGGYSWRRGCFHTKSIGAVGILKTALTDIRPGPSLYQFFSAEFCA